jgi:MerR family transcriptional regulator, redox-sensitive transcriptional activator SoxR
MAQLTISEVARQVGLRASAIRYYEQIGLVPRAERISGQRRYDTTALYRLAVIQSARQLGFTLQEVRELFFGFDSAGFGTAGPRTPPRASERWQAMSTKKLAEMDTLMKEIKTIRRLLHKMMDGCHCETLDQCGRRIFRSGRAPVKIQRVGLRPRQ